MEMMTDTLARDGTRDLVDDNTLFITYISNQEFSEEMRNSTRKYKKTQNHLWKLNR